MFAGDWELQVHARNSAAIRFWMLCVDAAACENPTITKIESSDGERFQFNFHVHPRHVG